jgi:phosphoribosyl-ATP pyrophosphohydrolase
MSRLVTHPDRAKNGPRRREPSWAVRATRGSHSEFDVSAPNLSSAGSAELDRLHGALDDVSADNHPRTPKLLGSGVRKAAQKVIEEAGEVALEAVKRDARGVVCESADLLYHLVVLWRRVGVGPADVWSEMHRRADRLGIAEKLPKAAERNSSSPKSDR